MFDLIQQLAEALTKQQLKKLMLQVQQECNGLDIDIELTKLSDEDGPSSFFVAKRAGLELKMHLHAPLEWLGAPANDLVILAIDWDSVGDYDIDGQDVFDPPVAVNIARNIEISLGSLEE